MNLGVSYCTIKTLHILRMIITIASGVLFGGCVDLASYPSAWSPIVSPPQSSTCPELAGTYWNIGEEDESLGMRSCSSGKDEDRRSRRLCRSLSYNLERKLAWAVANNYPIRYLSSFTTIEQPSNGVLVVRYERLDQSKTTPPVHEITLSSEAGDFVCNDRGLSLRTIHGWTHTENVSTEERVFNRAADGSLIMSVDFSSIGLAYIVPYSFKGSHWYRWVPASPD